MIYSYTYIEPTIQRFHQGVNSFFAKMIELNLAAYDERQHVADWFRPSVNASGTLLLGNFESFVKAYHALSEPDKSNISEVYQANQDVAGLCRGNGDLKRFGDITNVRFRNQLKRFFEDLWTRLGSQNGVNQQVTTLCGSILSHYQNWRALPSHKAKLCPFCGLTGLFPPKSPNRPAYDHYLPKALYPFVSVNFENLIPMCHACNSYEKTTTDTLEYNGQRRIVFYPNDPLPEDHLDARIVSDEPYNVTLLSTLYSDRNWHLELLTENHPDHRLLAWNQIFRIEGRYSEVLEEYETEWFTDLKEAFRKKESSKTFDEFRTDYLNDIRKIFSKTERSVIRYAYAYCLLHEDGIEEDLRLFIAA